MSLRRKTLDWSGLAFTAGTGAATFMILLMLAIILGNIVWNGAAQMSLRFIFGGTSEGMFDPQRAGIFPMIFGTAALVYFPHAAPAFLCGALPVGVGALIYVCGDERGFLSDSYVGKAMAEYERMRALPDPRPNWTPWEDG